MILRAALIAVLALAPAAPAAAAEVSITVAPAAGVRLGSPTEVSGRATDVLLPRSFRGRFRYVSCFVYSLGSGMGDPDQRCPRRLGRLR